MAEASCDSGMTTILTALNQALREAMERDQRVVFLGEDILDPYGGAFKVAEGLSSRFPDRVLPTPISEAAIIGVASGLALRGFRPIAEIMFGDFLTLGCDQLLNHACKYRAMYDGQVRVPMVIRAPMGGGRGYGPTHSQSIEKHFLGMPGLQVVAPNSISDARQLLLDCVFESDDPTLFIEHKLLYATRMKTPVDLPHLEIHATRGPFPTTLVKAAGAPEPSVTVAVYGYMTELVLDALWRMAIEQEILVEIVIPTLLHPMDRALLESVRRTRRLVTVEEGGISFGWGSEVISKAAEAGPLTVRRVGAQDCCIPASRPWEAVVLPSVEEVCAAIARVMDLQLVPSEALR